jgi:putative two-component system response regulator
MQVLSSSIWLKTKRMRPDENASPLHDVGKIGIPYEILLKTGELEPAEWKIMKSHPEIVTKILSGSNLELLQLAEKIALTHQEHWDGTGYPSSLEGEEIPLEGRIAALCDTFDSLTHHRPYAQKLSYNGGFGFNRRKKGS